MTGDLIRNINVLCRRLPTCSSSVLCWSSGDIAETFGLGELVRVANLSGIKQSAACSDHVGVESECVVIGAESADKVSLAVLVMFFVKIQTPLLAEVPPHRQLSVR